MKNKLWLFLLASIFILPGFSSCQSKIEESDAIEAFTKTYGLVRWFYPSDEAQTIDWNQFAIYGIDQVIKCKSEKELIETLNRLFLPIAPAMQFSYAADSSKYSYLPEGVDTTALLPVCWQHDGVELDESNYYVSKRLNKPYESKTLAKLCLYKYMPAGEYKGQKARLRMSIRTDSPHSDFYAEPVFLSFSYTYGNFDEYMNVVKNNKPMKFQSAEWMEVEKEIEITNNPDNDIMWGIYVDGDGSFDIRNIEVSVQQNRQWKRIFYENFLNNDISMWKNTSLYEYELSATEPSKKDNYLTIKTKNKLFDRLSDAHEVVTENIGGDILVQFPLVLFADEDKKTLPVADVQLLNDLKKKMQNDSLSVDYVKSLADIVVTWNIVNHFSPYLRDSKADWNEELKKAIDRVLHNEDDNDDDYAFILMMGALNDAHYYHFDADKYFKKYSLPFVAKKVDGHVVVTHSFDSLFSVGDIIKSVDGKDAIKLYDKGEERIYGSEERKNLFSRDFWSLRNTADDVSIGYQHNNEEKQAAVKPVSTHEYIYKKNTYRNNSSEDSIQIYDYAVYMKVDKLDLEQIKNTLNRNEGKTPIFDMRVGGSAFLIRYVLPYIGDNEYKTDPSSVPQVIRPNEVFLPDAKISPLPQEEKPKAIFLTSGYNLSNQESFLDYVKCRNLGVLIGENTGGCSGRINIAILPSGHKWCYTGGRAYSWCGEDFYGKGITPHHIVKPTIEDIKTGYDPVLNKALEVAQTMHK